MKLVTWNCQGAFRKKYPLIASQSPDLAVIQECENPERIPWKQGNPPTAALWFGDKPTRGLGVFSWTNLEFEALPGYDETIQFVAPIRVTAPFQFHLAAVWSKDHANSKLAYSAQIYQAIAAYREFILEADTLFLGDFNSSRRSTPRSRIGNHTTLTISLADLGMISAYHYRYQEKQGKETRGTFFRDRKTLKPAHIDYAWIPTRWLRRLKAVEVGDPADWLEHSDHCPLFVEFIPKDSHHMV